MPRAINDAGLAIIKQYEGLRLQPYDDGAGNQTIGYGHKIKDGEDFSDGITEDQAEALLESDLYDAENEVQSYIHVFLNDNQYSALVSLVFNCGSRPLTLQLGQLLNQGDYDGAAHHFLFYDEVNGVPVSGLQKRRIAESGLFVTPMVSSNA